MCSAPTPLAPVGVRFCVIIWSLHGPGPRLNWAPSLCQGTVQIRSIGVCGVFEPFAPMEPVSVSTHGLGSSLGAVSLSKHDTGS